MRTDACAGAAKANSTAAAAAHRPARAAAGPIDAGYAASRVAVVIDSLFEGDRGDSQSKTEATVRAASQEVAAEVRIRNDNRVEMKKAHFAMAMRAIRQASYAVRRFTMKLKERFGAERAAIAAETGDENIFMTNSLIVHLQGVS